MSDLLPVFAPVERLTLPDAELTWWPAWLAADAARELFTALQRETPWEQSEIRIAGRRLRIPRLNAWYGDPGAGYGYSGARLTRHAWTPTLAAVRAAVENATGHAFNSALLNLYRSGADSVDWHSDDEAELGPAPVIAALSLGATRRFELRHRVDASSRHHLELGDGALLLMAGGMQRHWRHRVPKESGVAAPRISVTFRCARPVRQWRADARVAEPSPGC